MLYSMHLQLMLALTFTEVLVNEIRSHTASRNKRAPEEKFRTLLHLYQMNPLKQSSVYENLVERLMMTYKANEGKHDLAMNFDSNESTRKKQRIANVKLKHIEQVIHAKPLPVRNEDLAYNVANVGTENFDSNRFLYNHNSPRHFSVENYEDSVKVSPNVDLLFGHIANDSEEDNKVILRKIRPANRTVNNKLVLNNMTNDNSIVSQVVLVEPVPLATNLVQYDNYSDIEVVVLK